MVPLPTMTLPLASSKSWIGTGRTTLESIVMVSTIIFRTFLLSCKLAVNISPCCVNVALLRIMSLIESLLD